MTMIAAVLLLALTGCSGTEATPLNGDSRKLEVESWSFYQEMSDGTKVPCIYVKDVNGGTGGPSCDWDRRTVDIGEDK
jgi:hypothetical protein